ncbi:MAG: DUF4124 domain-containing protein [Candidatus Wenzhouxiangella sp. M2_3B_020]
MTHRILPLMLLMLAAVAVEPAEARTYYKWVDDKGTTHFTAEPPNDRDYDVISTTGQRLGNRAFEPANPSSREAPPEPEPAPQLPREAELSADERERLAAQCEQARQNLQVLQTRSRIVVEEDDGTQRVAGEEDRQRLIDEAQALIREYCRD